MLKKEKKEKYISIKETQYGVSYFLRFRMPARFGGKDIQQYLSDDLATACAIRDKFVLPILTANSGLEALEEMAKSVLSTMDAMSTHVNSLKNVILGNEGITFLDALNKYITWMKSGSGLKPNTIQRYIDEIYGIMMVIGEDTELQNIGKTDAIKLREGLKQLGNSPATINHKFTIFKGFLRWLDREGLISAIYLMKDFDIDLPPVRSQNTCMIEPKKADCCMNVMPKWTFVPRIARYTGMRFAEIIACCQNYQGCSIVSTNGYRCFFVSQEFSKTHEERYIPISNKLAPYMTYANIQSVKKDRQFCGRGRSSQLKQYNNKVKKIEGCESVHFHSWRVYANTMMMEHGIEELLCMRILGHSSTSSVHFRYTSGRLEAMKKALDTIP